jgi:hypothetical protein
MRNEITFKDVNGRKVLKMRGGRSTDIIKDKKKYTRKSKHKKRESE